MRLIDTKPLEHLRYTHIVQFWDGKLLRSLPLSEAPTIDAVPVVRCKDCKHRKYLRGATADAYTCSLGWGLSGIVAEKDFCSYGERKDGAEDG